MNNKLEKSLSEYRMVHYFTVNIVGRFLVVFFLGHADTLK
jgi:hypothetical protein